MAFKLFKVFSLVQKSALVNLSWLIQVEVCILSLRKAIIHCVFQWFIPHKRLLREMDPIHMAAIIFNIGDTQDWPVGSRDPRKIWKGNNILFLRCNSQQRQQSLARWTKTVEQSCCLEWNYNTVTDVAMFQLWPSWCHCCPSVKTSQFNFWCTSL